MATFTAIYILIDFFEKIDNFLEKGKSMGLVVKFFLYNIPFVIDQMAPVCILLAGVITLGILNHTNELIGLKACGIPLRKIIAPIVAAGIFFTLFFMGMAQFVLPKTISVTNHIWNKEVKGRVPLGIYRNGRYYYRSGPVFYSFARPNVNANKFLNFSYSSWNRQYSLNSLISAESAIWHDGEWHLYKGQVQVRGEDGNYRSEIFTKRQFDFPENPDDFFVPEYRSLELSLIGLFREARKMDSPQDKSRAWADFYGRLSYITLGLPLLLLGLPLLLLVYRKWGRDLSLAVPVSCGLAFGCWGLWATLQSLAKAGYLNPFFTAVIIHISIGAGGLYLLIREDT